MVTRTIVAVLVVAAILGGGALALATMSSRDDGSSQGGGPPVLDVAQSAIAADEGITFSLEAAGFSGTATFIGMRTDLSDLAMERGVEVDRVHIPESGLAQSTLFPTTGVGGLTLPPSSNDVAIVRLAPAAAPGPHVLKITEVDVTTVAGETFRVTGNWSLPITLPDDLAARLGTEHLIGSTVTSSGISLAVEGAVRSRSETTVTLRLQSDLTVEQLGQPIILGGGEPQFGAVETLEGGALLRAVFPPTEFGERLVIRFGPFVTTTQDDSGSFTDIDLGGVLGRGRATGDDGASFVVNESDIVSSNEQPSPVRSVRLGDSIVGPGERVVIVEISGNYDDPTMITFTTESGRQLPLDNAQTSYRKDAAGVITEGTTEVAFRYNDEQDLAGTVHITHEGGSEIIRGDWTIELTPAEA